MLLIPSPGGQDMGIRPNSQILLKECGGGWDLVGLAGAAALLLSLPLLLQMDWSGGQVAAASPSAVLAMSFFGVAGRRGSKRIAAPNPPLPDDEREEMAPMDRLAPAEEMAGELPQSHKHPLARRTTPLALRLRHRTP